jgi:hypothetical protein
VWVVVLLAMARSGGELVVVEEDDEYAKLVRRMNPPRYVCCTCTH